MMIDLDTPSLALLPAGLCDLLPPEAEAEATLVESLMQVFGLHGYERVAPPLLEFEESLLAGAGAAVAEQIFRLMDSDTHRMMGVRADITPQIGRIASSRLVQSARPLRLSYAGVALRSRGVAPEMARQVAQVGVELIGPDLPEADAEIVLVAAEALGRVQVPRLSFDLTMPALVPAMLDEAGIVGAARHGLLHALDRKDVAAVAEFGGALAGVLTELLLAAGAADQALAALERAALSPEALVLAQRLAASVRTVRVRAPGLKLTVDPVEFRGFRYHTGVSVTAYSEGCSAELGRGGRYLAGAKLEPATGMTLFPEAVARVAPAAGRRKRLYVPAGQAGAEALREAGFACVAQLGPVADVDVEARRLLCGHILKNGVAVALPKSVQTESQ